MKTDIEEPSRRHKSRALLGIAGLMLSTGIVPALVENPPSSISQLNGHEISAYVPLIHAVFSVLNTVNFYLNLLLLLLHAVALHCVQGAPAIRVFITKHLPAAAQTVSFTTLVLTAPLFVHAAVSEESIGFAIGATLVCVSLIAILSSIFQQLVISGSFVPALLALCISSGFLLSADPFLSFDENHYDFLANHIPIHHLLLSFVSFVTLTLSLALVILRTGAPSAPRAENFIVVALSVAIAVLLVGGYMAAHVTVIDIGAVVVEAGEL